MSNKIKVLVVGYGNIGRGIIQAISEYPDMDMVGIVTRNPARVQAENATGIPILDSNDRSWEKSDADVAILCGGSKEDLPLQGPIFARSFNTVCSFDTHGRIDNWQDEEGRLQHGYLHNMDTVASANGKVATICQGWDPGIFSIMRAYFKACMGNRDAFGFYGLEESGGLSMGHSDALRRVKGVKDARQYTHAIPETIKAVRSGNLKKAPTKGDMHWRECFVVLKEGADSNYVHHTILDMPDYFAGMRTQVHFVSQEELNDKHSQMCHDGIVLGVAPHGVMEYRNTWSSNPLATAYILLAYARATARLAAKGESGAFTPLDIAPVLLLEGEGRHLHII